MDIHLRAVNLIGYGYSEGGSYDAQSPYQLVFSAFLFGDATAFIYATHGELSLAAMAEIGRQLKEGYGITQVTAQRNGRRFTYDVEDVLRRANRGALK